MYCLRSYVVEQPFTSSVMQGVNKKQEFINSVSYLVCIYRRQFLLSCIAQRQFLLSCIARLMLHCRFGTCLLPGIQACNESTGLLYLPGMFRRQDSRPPCNLPSLHGPLLRPDQIAGVLRIEFGCSGYPFLSLSSCPPGSSAGNKPKYILIQAKMDIVGRGIMTCFNEKIKQGRSGLC